MSKNWQKPAQNWNAALYASNARFVADLGTPVLKLLASCKGERLLDLGCGDGVLTKKIVDVGADVVGIDSSSNLVEAARALGLDARIGNGHDLKFVSEFDAVFSNAALHWMLDPDAVLIGVARALKPGGRFVAEFGGAGNVQSIVTAIESELRHYNFSGRENNPWYFPTASEYKRKLEQGGFLVRSIELVERPTPLPCDIGGWLDVFAESFFSVLPENKKEEVRNKIVSKLAPQIRDNDGVWWADYVRLRFYADHF